MNMKDRREWHHRGYRYALRDMLECTSQRWVSYLTIVRRTPRLYIYNQHIQPQSASQLCICVLEKSSFRLGFLDWKPADFDPRCIMPCGTHAKVRSGIYCSSAFPAGRSMRYQSWKETKVKLSGLCTERIHAKGFSSLANGFFTSNPWLEIIKSLEWGSRQLRNRHAFMLMNDKKWHEKRNMNTGLENFTIMLEGSRGSTSGFELMAPYRARGREVGGETAVRYADTVIPSG